MHEREAIVYRRLYLRAEFLELCFHLKGKREVDFGREDERLEQLVQLKNLVALAGETQRAVILAAEDDVGGAVSRRVHRGIILHNDLLDRAERDAKK